MPPRLAGEGIYRFLLRMPEELRRRLDDAASASGRSLNREIVHRLDCSFEPAHDSTTQVRGEHQMENFKSRRALAVLAVAVAALVAVIAGLLATSRTHDASAQQRVAIKQLQEGSQGIENGGAGGEAFESATAAAQFAEARTAPSGIVNPGAYSAALGQLSGLDTIGAGWTDVTLRKYDADSLNYRDYYSKSGGGSGNVTGRIVGLAADDAGYVYAAGAMGGIWRSSIGGRSWTPIADRLASLSSGDLRLNPTDGSLWYATGEANTGGTSYVGSGVYRLATPRTGTFAQSDRVGGDELESTTINAVRFAPGRVWVATLRGVWYMPVNSAGVPTEAHWKLAFAPNPQYLPKALQPYATQTVGAACPVDATTGQPVCPANAPYANIVNDIAVDPKNAQHLIAAIGWRSGALSIAGTVIDYNGFYESNDAGATWAKINPQGVIDTTDIGNVSFAFSKNGSKLYAINQSPRLLNKLTGTVNSYLDGIYVSNNGNPAGPWTKIAESQKLASSGSALKQSVGGKGYGPGIQAWYNQFLAVDPSNADHVYAGLEEVYESKDGGSNWSTVGPYWNFYFGCWRIDSTYNSDTGAGSACPLTTHSDQHSIAFGTDASGQKWVYVGNDGGVYRRPLNGSTDGNGNATDWQSLNDGTIDALQYYAVGIGKVNPTVHTITSNAADNGAIVDETKLDQVGGSTSDEVLVSGGLQDNGGSLVNPLRGNMVSNFGGDGGDVLVDPDDGCNIVQEYVVLTMTLTQTCGSPDRTLRPYAFVDLSQTTEFRISPPDVNARFIAPFVKNKTNKEEWMAGGVSLWVQDKGFAIRSGSGWTKAFTLASAAQTYTALAMTGDTAVGGWCGTCNNSGFTRGITIGHRDAAQPSGWSFADASTDGLPNRYVGGVAVADDGTIYAAMNGFSRRFTEGEGAGNGHVFKYVPATGSTAAHWDDVSANFPDIPANSIQALSDGSLVVGTDLAVLYRPAGATGDTPWKRLGPATGTQALPLTVAMDVELGPDNRIYAATHGRGIWSIANPGVAPTTVTTATPTSPKKKK
jgi:hypothetical protein